jgi:hypothetical protein
MTLRLARTTDLAALQTVLRQARGAKLFLVMAGGGSRVRIGRAADESTLQLLADAVRSGGRLELVLDRTHARREMIESDVVAAR